MPPPQWSPSLGDGMTMSNAGDETSVVLPQWSPSLGDGMTGRLTAGGQAIS